MVCVGIDVAKDKHDCFILSSEGEVLADVFTIANNREGFETLLRTIRSCSGPTDNIKIGLEATGHYSYNILGFLLEKGMPPFLINPLHTNLYRKSLSLRQTKTDRIDARTIASMLMSDVDLKSYTDTARREQSLSNPFPVWSTSCSRSWKRWCRHCTWRLFMPCSASFPAPGGLLRLI